MAAKSDEPAPHPPKDQLPNVSYCITSPPPWRKFLILFFFFNFRNSGYGRGLQGRKSNSQVKVSGSESTELLRFFLNFVRLLCPSVFFGIVE